MHECLYSTCQHAFEGNPLETCCRAHLPRPPLRRPIGAGHARARGGCHSYCCGTASRTLCLPWRWSCSLPFREGFGPCAVCQPRLLAIWALSFCSNICASKVLQAETFFCTSTEQCAQVIIQEGETLICGQKANTHTKNKTQPQKQNPKQSFDLYMRLKRG